jgi:hypothetical protein
VLRFPVIVRDEFDLGILKSGPPWLLAVDGAGFEVLAVMVSKMSIISL